jgi:hypothetical protein
MGGGGSGARRHQSVGAKESADAGNPAEPQALTVVNGWSGLRKCEYVFYNPETGEQWKDLWLGLNKASRKAGLNTATWHTLPAYLRVAAHQKWCGPK